VYMRNMLDKLFRNITYTERTCEKPNFKCLRQEATKWACVFGYITCFYAATSKLKQILDDNERYYFLILHSIYNWYIHVDGTIFDIIDQSITLNTNYLHCITPSQYCTDFCHIRRNGHIVMI